MRRYLRLHLKPRLWLAWDRAKSSLWLIPSVSVMGAAVLALVLVGVDERSTGHSRGAWAGMLFNGTAQGARNILAVISGSLVTVVAVIFSVTMIALQQASTQYTPRILRSFTRDRGNQVVFGAYLATFVYSLLVLQRVRGPHEAFDAFIPTYSIFGSIALALMCLALLIYFIHHATELMQVSHLLFRIREDFDRELERAYPKRPRHVHDDLRSRDDRLAPLIRDAKGEPIALFSLTEGYLRRIDRRLLRDALEAHARVVDVLVRVGEYVHRGDPVARIWPADAGCEAALRAAAQAFICDRERSVEQDPGFALRQMADVALKALSPSINDPTTAEQALDQLGGAIAALAERGSPVLLQPLDHGGIVVLRQPEFADYLELSFAQIHRAGRDKPHVLLHLLRQLELIRQRTSDPARLDAIRTELSEVMKSVAFDQLTEREAARIRAQASAIFRVLGRGGEPATSADGVAGAELH